MAGGLRDHFRNSATHTCLFIIIIATAQCTCLQWLLCCFQVGMYYVSVLRTYNARRIMDVDNKEIKHKRKCSTADLFLFFSVRILVFFRVFINNRNILGMYGRETFFRQASILHFFC